MDDHLHYKILFPGIFFSSFLHAISPTSVPRTVNCWLEYVRETGQRGTETYIHTYIYIYIYIYIRGTFRNTVIRDDILCLVGSMCVRGPPLATLSAYCA